MTREPEMVQAYRDTWELGSLVSDICATDCWWPRPADAAAACSSRSAMKTSTMCARSG